MLLAKIFLVALSLLVQKTVFSEKSPPVENELDTLALPQDHPERVLAKRAMSAQGLCPTNPPANETASHPNTDSAVIPVAPFDLTALCF